MQRNQVEEFCRELEAKDEQFVRQLLLIGRYRGSKAKHVKQRLAAKDIARAECRAQRAARWTVIGSFRTGPAAVVTVVACGAELCTVGRYCRAPRHSAEPAFRRCGSRTGTAAWNVKKCAIQIDQRLLPGWSDIGRDRRCFLTVGYKY